MSISDNVRQIRPRARYNGEQVYFADLEEFGVDGLREILIECGIAPRRAALDAFWIRDQLALTRRVSQRQSHENRTNLLAIRSRFEAAADEFRNRPIPRYVSSRPSRRQLVAA